MPYIAVHHDQLDRLLGTEDYAVTKNDWIDHAIEHGRCGDMLKMLEDLPAQAFDVWRSEEVDISLIDE